MQNRTTQNRNTQNSGLDRVRPVRLKQRTLHIVSLSSDCRNCSVDLFDRAVRKAHELENRSKVL